MDLGKVDLNQLVHLDVLLRELNVTKAANVLCITQPAMSNSLKRLRSLFDDPLLVRTSEGMAPTELALEIQPAIRDILFNIEKVIKPDRDFDLDSSRDRKSTRLNSSHVRISYAVFCLKKKTVSKNLWQLRTKPFCSIPTTLLGNF